jgi:PPK2 family polyphosphate:nucleotide phosphotransferase
VKASDVRLDPDRPFHWHNHDPRSRLGFADRAEAEKQLASDVEQLIALQDVFSANATYGMLIIIQGVDAAGKDGIIKHVMSGLNPQGVRVYPFRAPSTEERTHDYMWRSSQYLPARGRIAIFNRSYYEEVLVVRVNPDFLDAQRLPAEVADHGIWELRFHQMVEFERYLVQNGIIVLKFFMNISREEQLERLLERINDKDKNWKFSATDLETPQKWDKYRDAYEQMLRHTSSGHAPWYVIPADRKWVARLAVANVIVEHLAALRLNYPATKPADAERLKAAEQYIEGAIADLAKPKQA